MGPSKFGSSKSSIQPASDPMLLLYDLHSNYMDEGLQQSQNMYLAAAAEDLTRALIVAAAVLAAQLAALAAVYAFVFRPM
eukprot:tig00000254_g22560.t1